MLVDCDWADEKQRVNAPVEVAVLLHGCAVFAWARTQKTRALSSAENRVSWYRLGGNRRFGSSNIFATVAAQNSAASTDRLPKRACSVQAQEGPGRTEHVELKMFTVEEWLKTGRFRVHNIILRQHGRPHDQGRDAREIAEVRKEL